MDNTTVYLLAGVPLDSDQKHTLSWETSQAQIDYFISRRIGDLVGTYQRKDTFIRYDGNFDDVSSCNYVMYQNTNQSLKWYFAFVTDIVYINDERTDLYIKTDVLQTYYFDMQFRESFIERENVADDTFGLHTIPEGIELGPYTTRTITNDWEIWSTGDPLGMPLAQHIIIASNVDLATGEDIYGSIQGGTYSGVEYFGYRFPEMADIVTAILDTINGLGKIDGIKSMFMVPSIFVSEQANGRVTSSGNAAGRICNMPTAIGGYTPKNKKLLCYPYNMIYYSNKQGQNNFARYELFHNLDQTGGPAFTAEAIVNEGSKVMLTPRNYEGKNYNYDNAITLPSWPQCSFSSDTFTAWFAQNGASWAVGTIIQGVSAGVSVYTGNAAGAIGGFAGVFNSMMQLNNQLIAPPSFQGNSGSISTLQGFGENWFDISQKCITAEYAEKIDNYMEVYGYKVNRIGLPLRRSRPVHNYIKTIDCIIVGNINDTDTQEIQNIHNAGITYWRDASQVGNYQLNNH